MTGYLSAPFHTGGLSDILHSVRLLSVGRGKQLFLLTSPPVGKLLLRSGCDKIFISQCRTKFMLFLGSGSAVVINKLTLIPVRVRCGEGGNI